MISLFVFYLILLKKHRLLSRTRVKAECKSMLAGGILLLRRVLENLETNLICLRWLLEYALNHLLDACFSNQNEYRLVFENSSLMFNELCSCVAVKGKRLCSRWYVTQFQISWNLVPVDMESPYNIVGTWRAMKRRVASDEKAYYERLFFAFRPLMSMWGI